MVRAKMKPKRKVEYTLRPLMTSVRVDSSANGNLMVIPVGTRECRNPGVMTRLAAAARLQTLINRYLARRKLP